MKPTPRALSVEVARQYLEASYGAPREASHEASYTDEATVSVRNALMGLLVSDAFARDLKERNLSPTVSVRPNGTGWSLRLNSPEGPLRYNVSITPQG